jgi:2-dehydropantoate 2-reductase
MRIAFVGAGAVGCYFGARLAMAGNDVTFVVRTSSSVEALRKGIRIISELGDIQVPSVNALTDVRHFDPPNLIIVAVKLWGTAVAVDTVGPIVGPNTSVISLQNGVEKDETIGAALGHENILGAVTYIIVNKRDDGTVVHSGTFQRIVIGEFNGSDSDRVKSIVRTLIESGIDASSSPDIRKETWEKFIFLSSIGGMTASTRGTIGSIRSGAGSRSMLYEAMQEAARVARAEGVAIADDFVEGRMRFIDSLPPNGRSSMANDVLRGSRLELQWLSGAVVKLSERHHIPVPVHTKLYHDLLPFASGR